MATYTPPPIPDNEEQRLAALRRYEILDTLPEQAYDDITRLASLICGTPVALISLIDGDRQWFKSKVGVDESETPRDISFCAHALNNPNDMLIVPDASQDARFAGNPFVTGDSHLRFYAGAPLATADGEVLGTVCVADDEPRQMSEEQQQALQALARQVMAQLELRVRVNDLAMQIQTRQQMEIALLSAIAESDDIYNNAPCGYHTRDANGVFTRINNTELKWLGYRREDMIGRMTIRDILLPKLWEKADEVLEVVKDVGAVYDLEAIFVRADGSTFPVIINIQAVYNEKGEYDGTRATVFDITARKKVEHELRDSEARFQAFMDNGPFIGYMKDTEGCFVYVNEPFMEQFQTSREAILGKCDAQLWPPDIAAKLRENDSRILEDGKLVTFEETLPLPDGTPNFWLSFKFPILSSGRRFLGGISLDITERKFYERQMENYQRQLEEVVTKLEELALTDALTGLKNKGAFENRLSEEWQRARRYNLPLSLLLLDVDFFKGYNDTFGHPAGDEVLKKVAEILMHQARPSDFVARAGGEEFAVILANTEIEGAYIVAERLRRAIEGGNWPRRSVTASLGVASTASDMENVGALVESADRALYEAKRSGRNRVMRATSGMSTP